MKRSEEERNQRADLELGNQDSRLHRRPPRDIIMRRGGSGGKFSPLPPCLGIKKDARLNSAPFLNCR